MHHERTGKSNRLGIIAVMILASAAAFTIHPRRTAQAIPTAPKACVIGMASARRTAESASATVVPLAPDAFRCCEMLPAVFDKVRKVEMAKKPAAAAARAERLHERAIIKVSTTAAFPRYLSRLVDQHDIHVRNRVFRI